MNFAYDIINIKILYMEILFVQNVDLRTNSCGPVFVSKMFRTMFLNMTRVKNHTLQSLN